LNKEWTVNQEPFSPSPAERDKARILVVDDNRVSRKVLVDLLQDDYTVIQAKNAAQGLARVRDSLPDLILLDVVMPDMGGFEFLRRMQKDEHIQEVPVVFITAMNSLEDEEEGLKLGALDYIAKPFNPSIVKARVRNLLTMIRQKQLLTKLAHLDGLTEIPNRRSFEVAFQREWQRGLGHRTPLSLAILDVDFLKEVNDRFGHPEGDRVLKAVAQACTAPLRHPFDLAARYGGDEFVILLPETPAPEAVRICERIRKKIEALSEEKAFPRDEALLTVSMGGATAVPGPDANPLSLVKSADKALYLAKQRGRNHLVWDQENEKDGSAPG